MIKENKRNLGQFFTTNKDFILGGFEQFIVNKDICDPFAGNCDLLSWAEKNHCKSIKGFDIDASKINDIVHLNDSLKFPPTADFYLTNPPYLGSNKYKPKDKSIFLGYEDLYQAAIHNSINSNEGIFIVPVNFLSSEASEKARNVFFEKFEIDKIKYFSKQVFDDTKYNVICFHYKIKDKDKDYKDYNDINIELAFELKNISIKLEKKYGWRIGGYEISNIMKQDNFLGITRLHVKDKKSGKNEIKYFINDIKNIMISKVSNDHLEVLKSNKIILYSIDGTSLDNKIRLDNIDNLDVLALYSIDTSRNCIHIIFKEVVSIEMQNLVIRRFNNIFNGYRNKYNSLFLTNFRENDRKKVGFEFVYRLINLIVKKSKEQEIDKDIDLAKEKDIIQL